MKVVLDIAGLERELDALYKVLTEKVRGADASQDPKVAFELAAVTMSMDAMGNILRAIGHNIEGDEARELFLKLQRRFQGFKGAATGAAATAIRRVERANSKQ